MNCPRKFYYDQMLRLEGPEETSMRTGKLVHAMLEEFNNTLDEHSYDVDWFYQRLEQLFHPEADTEPLPEARYLKDMSPVQRTDLYRLLRESFADLDNQGFFKQRPRQVLAEAAFNVQPPLPRTRIRGRIDAYIQHEDGRWDIIDYKTSRGAFKQKSEDSRLKELEKVFEPFSPDASRHDERFKPVSNRNYQIPFYFEAARQDERFRGELRQVALQMVRPAFNDTNGSCKIPLDADRIEQHLPQVWKDLETHVIDPVLSAKTMPANPVPDICERCEFLQTCDQAARSLEGED